MASSYLVNPIETTYAPGAALLDAITLTWAVALPVAGTVTLLGAVKDTSVVTGLMLDVKDTSIATLEELVRVNALVYVSPA